MFHIYEHVQIMNFCHILVTLTSFYVFSDVILQVTPGNREKFLEKCRIAILLRVICQKFGQNQGKSLIFTKTRISQNYSNDKSYSSRSARNVKFGQVAAKHRPKRC